MRRIGRLWQLIGLLGMLVFALTGCMQADRDVKIASSGAGDYAQVLTFDKALYDAAPDASRVALAEYGTFISARGGSFSHSEAGGHVVWRFDWPFASLDELSARFNQEPNLTASNGIPSGHDQLSITASRTLFNATYHAQGTVSFPQLTNTQVNPDAFKDAKETLTLEFPVGVIAASGGTISGAAVTYTTTLGQTTRIDATASGVNWASTAPLIIAAILLLFLAGYGLTQLFSGE